jgi:tRNA(Ile)-lysidine synthase
LLPGGRDLGHIPNPYNRDMLERVAGTVERYRMFALGQRVGVAVSGGADSVCLLHVLLELAPRWNLQLTVLHVDHRLRGAESEADARFVADLAARLDLEVLCHQADVGRICRDAGANLEQAARQVRQAFFQGLIQAGVVDRVALGHTRSDQAETVLFRFLRGSGTAGLAGIRPLTEDGLVRPLIQVRRREVLRFLTERGIPWRDDSSNQDRAFARNRIRHDLLPALERDWNPALADVLTGVAQVAQDEEDYWRTVVEEAVEGNLVSQPPAIVFRAEWLAGLPPALARRVARHVIQRVKGDLRRIDLQHVEQILELARSQGGPGRCQLPGLDALRSFEWVRLAPPDDAPAGYDLELAIPGRVQVPGANRELVLELHASTAESGYNGEESEQLDWGRIPGTLRLRNWRPGDRYRPFGHAGEISVKSLFHKARIPRWERSGWPVIGCEGKIAWVARFGPAVEFAAAKGSQTLLKVREIPNKLELHSHNFGRGRPIDESSADSAGGGGL